MNSNLRAFLTAVAIATAVYFFVTWHPGGLLVGEPAPAFTLMDESDRSVSLSDYEGKFVLLHFWATWCSACMQEFPEFNEMAAHFKADSRIAILGLSLDDSSGKGTGWQPIRALNKQSPIHFKVLMDVKGTVADQFGTYALPETYLLGVDGRVLRKFIGPQDWGSEAFRASLKSELSN